MLQNLILQTFGRENEYKRAILTILSYYAHVSVPLSDTRVILFTDRPAYFEQYFEGLPILYVTLTPEKIRLMRGDIDFLHRMKIAVIEEAFFISQGNLLYADSDTFFIADPTSFMRQLSPNNAFMHLFEYQFGSMREWPLPAGKSFRDFLELIENQSFFLSNGNEITITPQHASWNAGVMMFHSSHVRFIHDVYALTEEFYPRTKNHASEQYAFSFVMQENTNLNSCDSVSYHYWYRIKKQIIDQFLETHVNEVWAKKLLIQRINEVKKWTSMLPTYFDKHYMMIRDHAIQAFNDNNFKDGYRWAARAIIRDPFGSSQFIKDTLYHIKRHITSSIIKK